MDHSIKVSQVPAFSNKATGIMAQVENSFGERRPESLHGAITVLPTLDSKSKKQKTL